MFHPIIRITAITMLILLLAGCSAINGVSPVPDRTAETAPSSLLKKVKETERFIFYYSPQDEKVIPDIEKTLDAKCPAICELLSYQYPDKIKVEAYADQKNYDESLADKSVAGSPACSGNGVIKLVSPTSPIKVTGIPYDERLMMAVHEYVHLMVGKISPGAPMWMNEGLASYMGSSDGYETICKYAFPKIPEVSFSEIETDYYDMPAPDVYSCTAVRCIIEKYGQERFCELLRNPEDFEKILQTTKDEFSRQWNEYIRAHFG